MTFLAAKPLQLDYCHPRWKTIVIVIVRKSKNSKLFATASRTDCLKIGSFSELNQFPIPGIIFWNCMNGLEKLEQKEMMMIRHASLAVDIWKTSVLVG